MYYLLVVQFFDSLSAKKPVTPDRPVTEFMLPLITPKLTEFMMSFYQSIDSIFLLWFIKLIEIDADSSRDSSWII